MIVLTILGLVGTAVFGGYTLYDQRRNRRVKRLVYDTYTVPLATAFRNDEGYKLSIQLERGDEAPKSFDAAYLTFVRFANFGREPIRRDDIAPANPLVVEAKVETPGEILDVSLSSSNRNVTAVAVESTINSQQIATAKIGFDFLDFKDGGIVRVLSTARPKDLVLRGDIIGMRNGISCMDGPSSTNKVIGRIVVAGVILVELAALLASVFAFRWTTGAWEDVWLLMLPPIALVLPISLVIATVEWLSPRASRRTAFPPELAYPKWARGIYWPHARAFQNDDEAEDENAWTFSERAENDEQ